MYSCTQGPTIKKAEVTRMTKNHEGKPRVPANDAVSYSCDHVVNINSQNVQNSPDHEKHCSVGGTCMTTLSLDACCTPNTV